LVVSPPTIAATLPLWRARPLATAIARSHEAGRSWSPSRTNGVVIRSSEWVAWSSDRFIAALRQVIEDAGYDRNLIQAVQGFGETGAALARSLGPHHALLMRGHGLTLVAESVPALLVDAVHFEENAKAMMQVLQSGAEPEPLTADELVQINKHEMRAFHIGKLWNYYVLQGIQQKVMPSDWGLSGI
jgi:ribulose-5-phosphate 4-epimerase/fuculose-1-phosphate aldolase